MLFVINPFYGITTMPTDRSNDWMRHLAHNTVLGDLLKPIEIALEKVRFTDAIYAQIGMMEFITLGIIRHIKSMPTLRESVQFLLHEMEAAHTPVARSTFSDALASDPRRQVLRDLRDPLLKLAARVLPDRLGQFPDLGERSVYAIDGTYQKESAHFNKCTPKQGGSDNPKGHQLLSFYDVRLGCPCDVQVATKSEHELKTLRDYDEGSHSLTKEKNSLWLVDRAFIDASFWNKKKKNAKITMITRMKNNLLYEVVEDWHISGNDVNQGVISDQLIALDSSEEPWRLITYRTRRGAEVEFLANEMALEPGLIAFLYSRRWEEEKCFDTWKNDFAQAKAWGKSIKSIENQTRMAIITSILLAMLTYTKTGKDGTVDEKSIDKQQRRQSSTTDGTDRPDWTSPVFRFTTKISRQVLRFFQQCLFKISSPRLYRTQLRPMLLTYL